MVTSSLPSRLATPREGILFSGLFLQTEAWGRAGKGGAALSGTPPPTFSLPSILQEKTLGLGPKWPTDHPLAASSSDSEFLTVMACLSPCLCNYRLPRILFELVNSPRGEAGRSLSCDRCTLRLRNERGT